MATLDLGGVLERELGAVDLGRDVRVLVPHHQPLSSDFVDLVDALLPPVRQQLEQRPPLVTKLIEPRQVASQLAHRLEEARAEVSAAFDSCAELDDLAQL